MEEHNEGCEAVKEEDVMDATYFIQVARAFKEGDIGRTHNKRFSVSKYEDWESVAHVLALDGEPIAVIVHSEEGDVDWRMHFCDTKGLAGDACRAIMKTYDLPKMLLHDGMTMVTMR